MGLRFGVFVGSSFFVSDLPIEAWWVLYTSVNLVNIGLAHGLMPVQYQAIFWTYVDYCIRSLRANLVEILIKIRKFSLKKIHDNFEMWAMLLSPQCVKTCSWWSSFHCDPRHRLPFSILHLYRSHCHEIVRSHVRPELRFSEFYVLWLWPSWLVSIFAFRIRFLY